ncbi:MAG: hypothetical protein L3K03_08850 [Thermoplasmata archaeon]|nr:hypothetical protein [Thermoplasmata archaeon]
MEELRPRTAAAALELTSVAGFVTVVAFVLGISFAPGANLQWHEWAGSVLLAELVLGLLAAFLLRQRTGGRRPFYLTAAAVPLLVVIGGLGEAFAQGSLPTRWASVQYPLLAVYAAILFAVAWMSERLRRTPHSRQP